MFHGRRKNPCRIFGDGFQRANADDPGNYTELGGSDYDVDNNELLCVTAGLLICDTAHPGGASAPARVRRRFKRTSTSQHARVVLGEQDANNCLYASVETVSGCDVLRLFQVVAGVATELGTAQTIGDGAPLDVWHTLEACLKINPGAYSAGGADIFRAKVTLASGKVYGTQAPPGDFTGGDKAGLDDSAGVRCDDFYFGWMEDDTAGACRGNCPDCTSRNPDCLIDDDTFPGGSETACKWDGDIFRVGHPRLHTNQRVLATFAIDDGQSAKVLINANRAGSAFHWAQLSLSGTTLTLSVGKTGSTLDDTTATFSGSLPATLTLCLEFLHDAILACVESVSLELAADSPAVADGYYAGRDGTVTWDYFLFAEAEPECPECDCADGQFNCCPAEDQLVYPRFMLQRIEGIVSGSLDPAGGCPSWNGNRLLVQSEANEQFNLPRWAGVDGVTLAARVCEDLPTVPGSYPYGYIQYQTDRLTQNQKECDEPPTYLVSGGVTSGASAEFWTQVPHTVHPIDFVDLPVPIGDMFRNSSPISDPDQTEAQCEGPGASMYLTAIG